MVGGKTVLAAKEHKEHKERAEGHSTLFLHSLCSLRSFVADETVVLGVLRDRSLFRSEELASK
jgi:hypothetical protein